MDQTSGEIVLDHKMFADVNPKFRVNLEEYLHDEDHDPYVQEDGVIYFEFGKVPSSRKQFISGQIRGLVEPEDAFVADELQALLCSGVVPGYALSERFWGYFQIEDSSLKPIEGGENLVEELQIDPKRRAMISDLIRYHNSHPAPMKDLVAEKGNGIIILLHGSPGCGKTLTAD